MNLLKVKQSASFVCLSGLLSIASPISAEEQNQREGDSYLDVMSEFQQYQEDTESEFKAFEEALNKAYDEYLGKIEETWGDQIFTDRHVWVQYDQALKQRTIVDYKNDTVTIEYVDVDPQQISYQDVTTRLDHTFNTDLTAAITNDPVLVKASQDSGFNVAINKETASQAMLPASLDSKNTNSMAVAEEIVQSDRVNTSYLPVSRRLTVVIELPEEYGMHKAERYWQATAKYAKEWKLEPALVMAVIHTESSFNPMARSRIPAYGLMQIVPRTAGKDAAKAIYGKSRLLQPQYLFDPDKNIRAGAAYLHVLNYRYLKGIHNPESRLYCMIAAYNTGTANVASAFIDQKSMQKAYAHINHLEPSEVYDILATRLPYEETRHYLKKVVGRYQLYIN